MAQELLVSHPHLQSLEQQEGAVKLSSKTPLYSKRHGKDNILNLFAFTSVGQTVSVPFFTNN
jgi:hypothetical protein